MAKKPPHIASQFINFRVEQTTSDELEHDSFLHMQPLEASQPVPIPMGQTLVSMPQSMSQDPLADAEIINEYNIKENGWAPNETKRLIRLSLDHYVPWAKKRKSPKSVSPTKQECRCINFYHVGKVWEHISSILKREGIHKLPRQCQVKWQNIKERAKKKKSDDGFAHSSNEPSDEEELHARHAAQMHPSGHSTRLPMDNHGDQIQSGDDETALMDGRILHDDIHKVMNPSGRNLAVSHEHVSGDESTLLLEDAVIMGSSAHHTINTSRMMPKKRRHMSNIDTERVSHMHMHSSPEKRAKVNDSIVEQLEKVNDTILSFKDIIQKQTHQMGQMMGLLDRLVSRLEGKEYNRVYSDPPQSFHHSSN